MLSVRIREEGWGYTARDETPYGVISTQVHPYGAYLQNELIEQLNQAVEAFADDGGASLEIAGLRLFETLFPQGPARDIFLKCLAQSASSQTALALRLRADEASRSWLDLPWEYLFDTETASYLLLGNVTLSRLPETRRAMAEPRPLQRILWTRPPVSSDHPEETSIRLEAPPAAEVILFTGHDLDGLDLAHKPVDILHASDTATLDELGRIVLGTSGRSFYLDDLYQDAAGLAPRLAFLEGNPGSLSGHLLARRALDLGSMAALSFQTPIGGRASALFTRVFYRRLRHGDSAEAAAAEARRIVAAETQSPAWGSAVLWLQQPDTPLFLIDGASARELSGADSADGNPDDDLDSNLDDDDPDEIPEDATASLDDDGLLRRLNLDPQALAVLHLAVAYTRQRTPRHNGRPRRLSSSALLLALADSGSRLASDVDVAFFKRCLQRPLSQRIKKDLSSLLDQWRGDDGLDLTTPFEVKTDETTTDEPTTDEPTDAAAENQIELPALTPNAAAMLRHARRLAEQSHGGPLGVRHLLAALFSEPAPASNTKPVARSQGPAYAHRRLQRAGHPLDYLRLHLFDHLQQQWPGDDQDAWRQALVGERPQLISRFADDRPQGTDRLFVEPYARALAAVIAAWETPQPLSIGVFGEWGSGKSFFMHLLNNAITDLKGNAARDDQGRRIFCRSIVQIDFNAWHYAESQIWASLVDHILRNLYEPLGKADGQAKLKELELIGMAQDEAKARLAEAETALQAAQVEKEKQLQGGEEIWRVEFWQTLPPELVPPKVQRDLETLQKAVGFKETLSTARAAYRHLSGIERARTGIRALVVDLWHRPGRPLLAAALAIVTLAVLSQTDLASWFDSPWWKTLGQHIASGLAVLVAFLAPVAQVARRTWHQLTALRDWLQTHRHRLDDELRQQLRIHQENVQKAHRRVEQLEKEHRAAQQAWEETQSPKNFSRFLRQRLRDNTYSQHLGVISAVHKDFRTLSHLLLQHKESRRMAEEEALASAEHHVAEHHVDRIVLYIDDLDRCPSATVVQVLEAIHLLLAFDLFVVVVGVDVRWVAQSLADRYPQHLRTAAAKPAQRQDEEPSQSLQRRATPHDYLEKIFQIPFWLPPMGQQASRNLIRALTVPQAAVVETTTLDSAAPHLETTQSDSAANPRIEIGDLQDGPGDSTALDNTAVDTAALDDSPFGEPTIDGPTENGDGSSLGPASIATAEAAASATEGTAPEQPVEAPETVAAAQALHMDEAEIRYMEALAGAVGRSPRRLKRFVNIYRILKATCTPAEALRFLRDGGRQGNYRAAMTLLALTTGAPTVAAGLYRLLERQEPTVGVGAWHDALHGYHRLENAPEAEAKAVHQAFDTYCSAVGRETTLQDLQLWAPRVKRFTFRSGG